MSLVAAVNPAPSLQQSQQFCQDLTRQAARNFYWGLRVLAEPRRSAMFALYAYMRTVDDIADQDDGRTPGQRGQELEQWRQLTHAALTGRMPDDRDPRGRVWPAFCDMTQRYAMPHKVFDEMIEAQKRDLQPVALENFDELYRYCYQVAGVVGLASIYIWGFEGGPATEAMAIDRGVAFQLTNILRDVCEDARRGRVYLPRNEMADMHVGEEDLRLSRDGPGFRRLMRFQADRAATYYQKSAPLESRIGACGRPTLAAMTQIYRGLLAKIAARPQRVLRRRVSLSLWSKLYISWRARRAV